MAAIPIGAYEPRAFMKSSHMNPEEAVLAFQDLGAEYAFGIHWGTFKLTLEKLNEPPILLEENLRKKGIDIKKFRTLQHGEIWKDPLISN